MSRLFTSSSLPKNIELKRGQRIKGDPNSVGKSEAQIEHEIYSYLEELEISGEKIQFWNMKIKGEPVRTSKGIILKKSENRGFGDILVCYHGIMICLEVKKPSGLASFHQLIQQEKIRKGGGIYEFSTSVNEVKSIFEQVRRIFKL